MMRPDEADGKQTKRAQTQLAVRRDNIVAIFCSGNNAKRNYCRYVTRNNFSSAIKIDHDIEIFAMEGGYDSDGLLMITLRWVAMIDSNGG